MKQTLLFFMLMFMTSFVFSQKIEIGFNKKTGEPQMLKKAKFDVTLINDTNQPIQIFYCHHKEYGGSEFKWHITKDGEDIQKGSMHKPMDTNSRFRKNAFVTIKPNSKKLVATLGLTPEEAGNYEVSYAMIQDPSTIDIRYAQDGAAKTVAKQITPMNIKGSMSFEMKPKEKKPFVAKEISYENLKKEKTYSDFSDATYDPSSIFKMRLDLKNAKDAEEKFAKMKQLKNIRSLVLNTSTSSEIVIPEYVGNLPLMDLTISGRTVNVVLPNNFLPTNSLKNLSLSNLPATTNFDFIKNHTGLVSLWLSRCGLKELPDWIGNLTELEKLSISNNQVSALPASLDKLTKLTLVNVSKNNLKELNHIYNNSGLEQIEAAENQLTSLPKDLGRLTKLTKLQVSKNQLTALPSEVGELAELKELWAENNQLTSIPVEITQLQKLRTFYFRENQVTALPTGMDNMKGLRSLNFKNNKVKEIPAELATMKKLRTIFAQGNPLNKKKTKKLKKLMKRKLRVD